MTHKHYSILGVDRNASEQDIKRAYKKKAMENHPDRGGDAEKFKEVSAAYEVLSDPGKKNQYDQVGDAGFEQMNNGGGGMNQPDIHDIFAQMFGGASGFGFNIHGMHGFNQPQQEVKRGDVTHNLNITLDDAYRGVKKTIKLNINKPCLSCLTTCQMCQGKGQITEMRRMGIMTQMITRACDTCKGTGNTSGQRNNCTKCNNTGSTNEERIVELDITKGVTAGHQIRIAGCGEQPRGPKEIPGDLIFHICIENHKLYERHDGHLLCIVKLSFVESILGKILELDHFSGKLSLDLKKFTIIQPEKKYVIEGKGMPERPGSDKYGNLVIQFNIDYPKKSFTEEEHISLKKVFDELKL